MKRTSTIILIIFSLILSGCATARITTKDGKRKYLNEIKAKVLNELYIKKPGIKSQIAKAPGYAVFSNINVNFVFAAFGGGNGVVENNKTGKLTYMNMGEFGLGAGFGVKDFRAVIVFHDADALERFVTKGWAFGAQVDAAIKSTDKGVAVGAEATVDAFTIYQLTESGVLVQAIVKGTKFWRDPYLN